jgi:hypothetical protein
MEQLEPLLGEIKDRFIDNEVRKMVWNGEKWLFYADVYPLMYYVQTGKPLDVDKRLLR